MKKGYLIVLGSVFCSLFTPAWATMMIFPKYVSLDEKTRVAEMMLINPSNEETINYRIRLKSLKQMHDGSYQEVLSNPDEVTGASLIKHSPKSVTLSPKKSQTVKLLKRIPESTPEGEYPIYIVFTKIITEKPLEKKKESAASSFSVELTPIPSFAIPVSVVVGNPPKDQARLTYLGVNKNFNQQPLVQVRLARTGTTKAPRSRILRGDISIWSGNDLLGFIKGKYLLSGNDYVNVEVPLQLEKTSPASLYNKKVEILFTQHAETDTIDVENTLASTSAVLTQKP